MARDPLATHALPFALALCLVAPTFAADLGRILLLAAPVGYVAAAYVQENIVHGPLPAYPVR